MTRARPWSNACSVLVERLASCLNTRYTRRAAQRGYLSIHRHHPALPRDAGAPSLFLLSPLCPLRSLPDHSFGGCGWDRARPTVLLTVTLEEHHPQHHAEGVGVELEGAVPGHAAPVAAQPGTCGGQERQAQQLRHGHVRREPGGAGGRRGPVHGTCRIGRRAAWPQATAGPCWPNPG